MRQTRAHVAASCDACDYASNLEKAAARALSPPNTPSSGGERKEVSTPGKKTIEEVTQFLKVPAQKIVKTVIFESEKGLLAGLVRGDRQINPVKLKNLTNSEWLLPASEVTINMKTGLPVGYVGPVGLDLPVYADQEITIMGDFVTGANKPDTRSIQRHSFARLL